MTDSPSSRDLHPATGARFVFDQIEASPLHYRVAIHLAGGHTWLGRLAWANDGAELVAVQDEDSSDATLSWARSEALKLARVLHRDAKRHMVRWRGPS